MIDCIIDTNCILRYLLSDNTKQADQVQRYFTDAKQKKIYITVPFLVFFESVFMLMKLYKMEKRDVVEKLTVLAGLSYLDIEKRNILLQALSFFSKTNISFVDSVLLVEARQTGKQLLTFDKKLKKLV
ncbi:hypothetical protein A3D03_03280 [Candidatus Gottesmanbacteria bacterium RIFCSPHIGHO2_02_FULL_40_13]|uniref:PIN domain-containing protein n=1 Tax=Candidatus Gottesmanbacteria bacterium RIFCSPHIGHO2_02_FULL_40_13 TaxID=1798384 RepID=A0A1F6A6C4_9BACT|nr:MAG: hypothetical protein A3D03_03280 [Candidatus Gottesmanbacteria bacterium RIFCSPHIGHO2_02_FULL_40_13]